MAETIELTEELRAVLAELTAGNPWERVDAEVEVFGHTHPGAVLNWTIEGYPGGHEIHGWSVEFAPTVLPSLNTSTVVAMTYRSGGRTLSGRCLPKVETDRLSGALTVTLVGNGPLEVL